MMNAGAQLFRMKANCVVGGVPWWREGAVYSGRHGTGAVQTVHLAAPNGSDSLEVLRGSVIEVREDETRR